MSDIFIQSMDERDIGKVHELGIGEDRFRLGDNCGGFWSKDILKDWVNSETDVALVARVVSSLPEEVRDFDDVSRFLLMAYHPVLRKATFENAFIVEEYRGLGLARMMYEEAQKRVGDLGARFVCSYVETDNSQGKRFLESVEFSNSGKFNWMHKDL